MCEGFIVDSKRRVSTFSAERKGGLEITEQIRNAYKRAGFKYSRIDVLRVSVNALDMSFWFPSWLFRFWCAMFAVESMVLGSFCS